MCELTDRSLGLESKLRDLDCPDIELSLAAARLLFEESLRDEEQNAADAEQCRLALAGALMIVEAVIEQLSTRPKVYALDGDVQFGPYSYAPGRMCADLRSAISQAEVDAKNQREAVLRPLALAAMTQAHRETLAEFGVTGFD